MKTSTTPSPAYPPSPFAHDPVGFWSKPVRVARNNFIHKSLSCFAGNIAVGCGHACSFCSVVSTSANKLADTLELYGVGDPDADWGTYALLRPWDREEFLKSVLAAEKIPHAALNTDGNRAIILCSTTDPYQVFRHRNSRRSQELNEASVIMMRGMLTVIRDNSTLNVRILTRSPLAKRDFDLFKSFGPRLTFGMSLPTLDPKLHELYEPHAPSPLRRLETLRAAREAGLNVYVAMAPTFPESTVADLDATMAAIASVDPITVFHEPINIRAENVVRMTVRAASLGIKFRSDVFATALAWRAYSRDALMTVESLAARHGLADRLHLWPDIRLGSKVARSEVPDPVAYDAWLNKYWNRVSEWPVA